MASELKTSSASTSKPCGSPALQLLLQRDARVALHHLHRGRRVPQVAEVAALAPRQRDDVRVDFVEAHVSPASRQRGAACPRPAPARPCAAPAAAPRPRAAGAARRWPAPGRSPACSTTWAAAALRLDVLDAVGDGAVLERVAGARSGCPRSAPAPAPRRRSCAPSAARSRRLSTTDTPSPRHHEGEHEARAASAPACASRRLVLGRGSSTPSATRQHAPSASGYSA